MRSTHAFLPLFLLIGCTSRTMQTTLPETGSIVEAVTYPASKDLVRAILYRPAGGGPFPGVVLVHGDFGLTEWLKAQAQRLVDQGYVVVAVDLYRGEVVKDLLEAHIMDRGLPEERVLADLQAAVSYLISRPEVSGDAIGILGWDMGGGYALDAALHDARLRALVTCYGRLTTDATLLAPLQASVLGIFAGKDEGISPETIAQFQAAMQQAGKRIAVHIYPTCGHGFMDPTSPVPTGPSAPEAMADAWKQIETHLAAELKR